LAVAGKSAESVLPVLFSVGTGLREPGGEFGLDYSAFPGLQ
jgi:hypothetical protein